MAYNETRITLSGIVASPVTRTTVGTGDSRAKFRMLTTERRFDPDRQVWVSGAHMFLSVTCWRALADNVHLSLTKNDPIVVHGKMTIKELTEGEGVRQFVDVEAQAVGPNLASCTAVVTRLRKDGDATTSTPRSNQEALIPHPRDEPAVYTWQKGGDPPDTVVPASPDDVGPASTDGEGAASPDDGGDRSRKAKVPF
ncbi:single-strand DNA-binding protein [Saccharothrix tamanrassetensis]|uniref:Single-strand DNA-binding protein n=1 Tax=Saccharothrix tamanrassetensis TaxID=1051531 RepID=A0A841CNK0_9PSEU|nr:single-stranded DNA-binding protein [Saccharothrix tamanrassetensis]MBB5957657.1 single-strand DNA-binding protein [Saccharothrix tamanrassetensis]